MNATHYNYGPFGEVIRATGPMAKSNPFRFSTKYQDDESDLLYYGYRYLNTSTGRWLSQDAIRELGFLCLTGRQETEEALQKEKQIKFLRGLIRDSRIPEFLKRELRQMELGSDSETDQNDKNLYGFVSNNPTDSIDSLGLASCRYECV